MKATYPRAELPALLERVHAALARVEARIVELEHEKAELCQRLAATPRWRMLFPRKDEATEALHDRAYWLPFEISARRGRRDLLENVRLLTEYALGTQAESIILSEQELKLLGLYGQGEAYE